MSKLHLTVNEKLKCVHQIRNQRKKEKSAPIVNKETNRIHIISLES